MRTTVAFLALVGALAAIDCPTPSHTPVTPYSRDPDHLWNRVHAALLVRTGPDGKDYGHDRLEPLLWDESEHLLKGKSAERAVAVLDEFLREKGESLFDDPVKRAVLQRDLWLVANWMSGKTDGTGKLRGLLAQVIQRLALPADRIAKLPDNYAAAVASKRFAAAFDPERPERAYLPPDLFRPDGPWVCVGRTDGHTAPLHLQPVNPFSNSTFLVFLKLPGGRKATLDYVAVLTRQKKPIHLQERDEITGRSLPSRPNPDLPQLPKGTELALVRRAMLIDAKGQIVASPLTENVQLRAFRAVPAVPGTDAAGRDHVAAFDLQLRRADLFAKEGGGLRDVSAEADFKTGFASHGWDQLEPAPFRRQFQTNRQQCLACHASASIYSTMSFQRYVPSDEQPGTDSPPLYPIAATTVEKVEQAAIKWKVGQPGWKALAKPPQR
jgi:hypothetical protein